MAAHEEEGGLGAFHTRERDEECTGENRFETIKGLLDPSHFQV